MINSFKEKLLYKFTKKYWKLINQKHGILNNFTVQNGLFKDLKLNKEQYWNSGDLGSKIYGFYEKDVQEIILGCSHYPLVYDVLKNKMPSNIRITDPSVALVNKFNIILEK